MDSDEMSEKRKALLAYMEQLRKEIGTNEATIVQLQEKKRTFLHFPNDSDSDDDLLDTCQRKLGPSMSGLTSREEHLRTRLQATEELTGVQVVQSEVNVLVDAPHLDDEEPPSERGVWREVTAECRAETLRFTISFCVHQPNRRFAPLAYYNLRVDPVKEVHATELETSILGDCRRPSDAVQVIRSYAVACRSRRDTVTRIAELYAGHVTLEKLPKGGFVLKCLDSLELTWVLENKWSCIAPFYHRMDFEVTNMDDMYIDKILPVHKQIQDPTIDTEERTNLLSKIIKICIDAKAATETSEDESTNHNIVQDSRKRTDKHVNDQVVSKERAKKQTEKQTDIATLVRGAPNENFNKKGKRPIEIDNGSRKKMKNDEPKENTNAERKENTKKHNEPKENTKGNAEGKENTKKNHERKENTKKNVNTNKEIQSKDTVNLLEKVRDSDVKVSEKDLPKIKDVNKGRKDLDENAKGLNNKTSKDIKDLKKVHNSTKSSGNINAQVINNKVISTVSNDKVIDRKEKENVTQKNKTAQKHVIQKDTRSEIRNDHNIIKKKEEALNHVFKKPKPIEKNTDLTKKYKNKENLNKNNTKVNRVVNTKISEMNKVRVNEKISKSNTEMGAKCKSLQKMSKIPQRMTSFNDKLRNPLRMSPRFVKNPAPKTKTMFTLTKK